MTRRAFIAAVTAFIASVRLRAQGRLAAQRRIVGAWSGAVTDSSATIKILTIQPGLPIALRIAPDTSSFRELEAVSDADGVAEFSLTGLQSRSSYRYTISTPGEAAVDGGFRTFGNGPFSFRVVFGSCANTGSTSPVFEAMQAQEPDLFVHMGDLHYENISRNDVARFRTAFLDVHSSPTQSALFRSVPLAYVWDDHDYGTNDSDRRSPSRPAAIQAYRRFTPHYPLNGNAEGSIQQAFNIGRVRFIMTDSRSQRSPQGGPELQRTMLGASQVTWLIQQFEAASAAPMVVWVNTVPWITKNRESTGHGWGPYARERRALADAIVRLGLTERLVMLSGDAHMLALDDGTNSQYSALANAPRRGFVVAHAAPMDRDTNYKGGPYSVAPISRNGQFGVMDVIDDGGRIRIRIQGMRGAAPVEGMRLEVTL